MLISGSLLAQNKMSCCSKTDATEEFAVFASDKNFMATHESPLPFTFHPVNGKDIEYKTDDGTNAHAFEVKTEKNSPYWIIVIHEWWGLNDYIKQESEKLFGDFGVNVLAIDLYDRKIATNQQEASQAMQAVKTERAVSIIKGAIAHVGKDAKILTIGWCFGGGWSLQTALLAGKQAAGCVMYYGMPEKDVEKLKTLNCDVLGIFATQDGYITPQVVNEFAENMKKAGKNLSVHNYDAVHAFANPSNPKYDKASADDAFKYVTEFYKERIK
ncbi:MAG: dienelactone hydrolase [Bacteroidetes bacterium]|nr:MAG: dienelactone hydrolase [Bacteroidota bacterium]